MKKVVLCCTGPRWQLVLGLEHGRKAVESTEVESVVVSPAVGSVPAADPPPTSDLVVCDCVEDFY